MHAIRIHGNGGPEVMQYEQVALPDPGPGEVRLRVEAAGVNYIDVYHRAGGYPLALPFTPGVEAAGVIDALGPQVAGFQEGQRVAYAMQLGSYAQFALVPAEKLVPIPEAVDTNTAAAVILQGMTAHYLVHSTYPLKGGETALVHAAAGGVGLLLVQLAKERGARVIGTVSTEEKARLAREAGADEVILYEREDFEAETRRLTSGAGVEVVYDSVGQATFEKSLNCLKARGCLALYGQASGPVAPLDPQVLNTKGSLFLTRPSLGHYLATREELLWRAGDLFDAIQSGELHVRIDTTFPLGEAPAAHRYIEGRKTRGKILLIP